MNKDCINELNEAQREGYDSIMFDDTVNRWVAFSKNESEHRVTLDYYYPLDFRYWYQIKKLLVDFTD